MKTELLLNSLQKLIPFTKLRAGWLSHSGQKKPSGQSRSSYYSPEAHDHGKSRDGNSEPSFAGPETHRR